MMLLMATAPITSAMAPSDIKIEIAKNDAACSILIVTFLLLLDAGDGIEPPTGAYETPEIPFL